MRGLLVARTKAKRKKCVEGLRFVLTTQDVRERMLRYTEFLSEVQEGMTRRLRRLQRLREKPLEEIEAEMRAAHELDQFSQLPHDAAQMKQDGIEDLERCLALTVREAEEVSWLARKVPERSVFDCTFEDIDWMLPGLGFKDSGE